MEMLNKAEEFHKDVEEFKKALAALSDESTLCDMSVEEFRMMRAMLRLINSTEGLICEQTMTMSRIESKLDQLLAK